jgi:hypothetical protein
MTGVPKALVTVLAVLSCAGLPVARSKPSFAGKWALPNLRDGVWSPFGSWFIAVQDEHTLSIEKPLGGESRKTFDAPSPIEVNMRNSLLAAPFTAFGFPLSSVTRSGWEGDQLVVVTHTIEKYISAPGRTPREFESDRVHWMAISLDKDGRLVVEVLQFGDPGPWDVPSRSPSPSSQRIAYTRMR